MRRFALSIPTCDFEKTVSANTTVLKHMRVQVWVICGDDSGPGVQPVATKCTAVTQSCSQRVDPAILSGRVDLRVDRKCFRNNIKIQDYMGC